MDNLDEIAEELERHFLVHNYEWKFEYGLSNPDADDLKKAIQKAVIILEAQEGDTNLEVGHLLFTKRANVIDIFVHTGTIGENSEDSSV
ncbi:hypothetical protein SEA_ANNADREAMY_184 [Streptomyces phage Annadreamy]|uniref:Uncharacterized protein n=2 Tax=Annadreamyvirus annadreamy TaxID=2846392 RepID=A0A345GTJ7_9CAUD|nr:hypothetical protein HWB75_gp094 [Streptomyces phage Annadreamy]AXG66269.1 hypothetical protein SEA_ANNADREAMY_184 [Streptomyces phage Annadreamy]QGH79492.1 hypothetical protein SEA_LIMPID_191 [Streptomyces phage Limpid]